MADLNYIQEILVGDQVVPVNRREVILDWLWNRVKTICVPIAGISILLAAGVIGYWLAGGFSCNTCGQTPTQSEKTGPSVNTGTVVTVPGIERLTSAIEKVAEAKPSTMTAMANATTIATKTPTPPAAVIKMPDHLTVEVKGLIPPEHRPLVPERPKSIWDPPANR